MLLFTTFGNPNPISREWLIILQSEFVFALFGKVNFLSYQNEIVATYRMIPLHRLKAVNLSLYSAKEFDFELWLKHWGFYKVFELGRACVDPVHRAGNIFLHIISAKRNAWY